MKIITANVNGIRAAARKGFFEWLQQTQADVVCLQEVRAHVEQLTDPIYFPKGYHHYYIEAEKKGYSGVALFCKQEPNRVVDDFQYPLAMTEGRYIHVEYEDFIVASIYFPSGTSGDHRQDLKYEFMDYFEEHMQSLLKTKKKVILCGDWNIAHTEKDIKNWKGNLKNSGFLPEERAWLDKLFSPEFQYIDAFRVLNQDDEEYTWWSQRGKARANNVGWRIDYQVVSENVKPYINQVDIYRDENFSDHAPLIVEYNF